MPTSLAATDLLSFTTMENPYPLYSRLRQEAPVWQVPGTKIFVAAAKKQPDGTLQTPRITYGRNGAGPAF